MLVNGSLQGGGAEHVIATLARHLRQMAHPVTIAVVHDGGEVLEELKADGFKVVTTGAVRGSSAAGLRRVIETSGVQVVHSHDLRSLIDGGLCRLRSRRFVHLHTFHFGNYPSLPWKALLMEAAAARVPDRLVAVGHAQRASLSLALRLRESRIATIWNGVDALVHHDGTGMARDPRVPRIGSVSTFGVQKGLPTLLEAAKIAHDRGLRFRLVLVGEGPLRRELEEMVAVNGLADSVEFTGWQPDAARTLLPTFDIFVQSSHWEAMSVVILEAMAARRPIVATTVGENTSVLAHDESAILVPPGDAGALAAGLARMIEDVTLRSRLAESAFAAYAKRFTGRSMAERYATAYRDCLATRGLG